jgi:ankyrin repeat protein
MSDNNRHMPYDYHQVPIVSIEDETASLTSEAESTRSIDHLLSLINDDETTKDEDILQHIKVVYGKNEQRFKRLVNDIQQYKSPVDQFSVLHYAAQNCRPLICIYLIETIRVDKKKRCRNGKTALHVLIEGNVFNHTKMTEKLIHRRNLFLQTIDVLLKIKTPKQFSFLDDDSADYNLKDNEGQTALHMSALINNIDAFHRLVKLKDIDLNVKK